MSVSSTTAQRLAREYKSASEAGIQVQFNDNNLLLWNGTLDGPGDSPYRGGLFEFKVDFPAEYPFKPPSFTFTTPVFHPNITDKGEMCIPRLLPDNWSPATPMTAVFDDVIELFKVPDITKNSNPTACQLYKENISAFNKRAAEETDKYANPFK